MEIIKINKLNTQPAIIFHDNAPCPIKLVALPSMAAKYYNINIEEFVFLMGSLDR